MRYRLKKGFFTFLIALLVLCMTVPAISGSYSEDGMRLVSCRGSVEILDASGILRTVTDDFTLSSGDTLLTGKDARASVSLGKAKRVNLDEDTTVKFVKTDKDLELTLTQGTLLLNVSEKLAADESLRIKTPHVTANIRGTIVFVSVLPADQAESTYGLGVTGSAASDDNLVTVFGVLEGTAALTYTDEAANQSVVPSAGKALMLDAGKLEVIPQVQNEILELNQNNVTPFIQEQLKDDTIINRVREACPQLFDDQPFPANGDWEYTEKVMIVARSASKLYDGNPLTRTGDILVYGLPDIFDITAYATGSITNAGKAENPIGPYAIFNQAGDDVTSHFKNVVTVPGQLVVDPAPMTIWTGSATKAYDGTPLTNVEAGFDLISGKDKKEPWRNTSLVLSEAEGETLYGLSGTSLVHGTNPLTGETKEIVLSAGEKLTVHLNDESDADSLDFKVETISEEEIPEEILRLYANNTALLGQACEDAGWDEATVLEYIGELSQYSGPTTTKDGLIISVSSAGGLMRELTNVRINVDADITDYSGRALNGEEAHFAEVRIDSSVKVTATGSQTEAGESDNTYEIDWGNEDLNNFIITEDLGVLKVLPSLKDVTVTAVSAMKVYDGTPLLAEDATVTGLPDDYSITAEVKGELTDAGTGSSVVTAYQILNANGEDVTEFYPDIRLETGTLTVEPAPLQITTGSANKVYDGQPLTNGEASVSGFVSGESAAITATGGITNAGQADNSYAISWLTAKAENYTITEDLGVLTVEPLEIGVSWGKTSAIYNGSPYVPNPTLTYLNGEHAGETVSGMRLRASEIMFAFDLFTGDTIQLTVSGFGSDAGTYTINPAIRSSPSLENFSVSGVGSFTFTIEPASLTVATGSASKLYDGTPLTASEVTVTGLQDGDSITVTATGALTEVGTAENTYSIDWGDVNPDNYSLTENLGTLTVEPNADVITLTAGSAERVYDGSALTTDEYSIEGNLPDGVEVSATVGGSRRDAGSSESAITSYTFTANGEDVTASYTNVVLVRGTLTVTPADLTISTGSASKEYDGAPLTASEVTVTGLQGGDSITVTATGSLTNVGTAENTYSIDWGDVNPDNYTIRENLGALAVEPNTDTITLTAGSVDKVYNGSDLTTEDYTLEGELPYGVELSVTVGGSQRDAGSSESAITSYAFTANGEDVTANFTSVVTVNGTLTVTPADLTISTGSASKGFDGSALTCGEAEITGLAEADIGKVTVTATGSITNAGSTANGYTIDWGDVNPNNYTIRENLGTLAVEPNTDTITLTAGSVEKVYDGSDLTTEDYTLEGELPYGVEVSVTVGGSRRDAGSSESAITSYAFTANGENVTANFTSVVTVNGTLTVTPADLTISTGSASKGFDGSALTCGEAEITGLAEADIGKVTVTATGSITNAGSTANGYTIDWGDVNPDNYAITEDLGTLEVTNREIKVTTGSANKVYDGTELTCAEASVSGLKEEDEGKVTVTATGSITNAGSTANSYTIDWGDVDPNQYTITESLGTLTVDTLQLNIAIGAESMTYCGSLPVSIVPFVPITVTVGNGTHAGETINYSSRQYNVSKNDNVHAEAFFYTFPEGNRFALLISGFSEQAGSHPLGGSFMGVYGDSTLLSNYSVSIAPGTFTVNPIAITVTTGSASKPHDGSALTCAEAKITGLVEADKGKVTVTATGSQTDVGSTKNTYSIDWGGVNPGNYTITEALGTLEVTEPEPTVTEITITTGSANKVYDGTELTCAEASVSGLKEADKGKVTVTATGSQTNVGSTENTYSIDWGGVDESQYAITENLGTLTVDALKLRIVINNVPTTYTGSLPVSSIYYPDITMTVENGGSKGETIGYASRQFITSGSSVTDAVYFFGFPEGDEFSLNVAGFSPQVGNHTLTGSIGTPQSSSTQLRNYDFSIASGTFTVNPVQITVTTGSANKVYDGSALTCAEASITGLLAADQGKVTVTATGSQTNAGSSTNTYSIDWGDVDSSHYTVVENLGTLSVTNPGGSDDPENPEIPDDGTITLNPNTNQLTYTNTDGKTTYQILDFNNCSKYITNNRGKMSSGEIVAGLISCGYIGS